MTLSDGRRRVLARLQKRRSRQREGLVLVEGIRGVGDALSSGVGAGWAVCAPRLLAVAGGESVAAELERKGVETVWVTDELLNQVAGTETPQGVLLVMEEPRLRLDQWTRAARRLLVVDGIQDPGNVGTLIRSSYAFGLDGVIALDGTTDPWGTKAVRSAAGACFALPVAQASWLDVRLWLEEREIPLLVASAAGEDVAALDEPQDWALVVGAEARGVRDEIEAAANGRVSVPMPGGAESLNAGVAGSILLYTLTRNGKR